MDQLAKNLPDYIFMPVGNATLFSGVCKGLIEFRNARLLQSMPKLVAVQSKRCDPLIRAYRSGRRVRYVQPRTEADAIAVGYPTFGFEGLEAIRKSGGSAVAVGEDDIKNAVMALEKFKVYAELGGGTGFAGFLRYCKAHAWVMRGKRVVVVVTGNNEGMFRAKT